MASRFSPEVRKVGQRLGTLNPAWIKALPNLPNLPNLFLTCAHPHTHTRAYTRAHMNTYVRKVRKVRNLKETRGLQPSQPLPNLPNLCLEQA